MAYLADLQTNNLVDLLGTAVYPGVKLNIRVGNGEFQANRR